MRVAGAIVVSALALVVPASASAALRQVAVTGANIGDCTVTACQTIGYAMGQANDGDTIDVAAGTYDETVAVSKRVRLEGAQSGVDARTRSGPETRVTGASGGFSVGVGAVTIDGFSIEDGVAAAGAIETSATASGYRILNNVIQNNDAGIALRTDGVSQTVIRHNAILTNDQVAGSFAGYGIAGDVGVDNTVIDENSVAGNPIRAIGLTLARSTDVAITGNGFSNNGPIELRNIHTGSVADNTIGATTGPGVLLGGGNAALEVRGNRISGSTGAGVSLTAASGAGNRDIDIVGNVLAANASGISASSTSTSGPVTASLNRIVGNAIGVSADAPAAIDATENWWGCNGGPGAGGCDTVVGAAVTSNPWLVLRAAADRGRILTNGDSNHIDAGISSNSDLDPVDASLFPASTVDFVATLGSVTASAATSGGIATARFVAGSQAGTAVVTAELDGASVMASFEVSSQAGPTGPTGTTGPTGGAGPTGGTGPAGSQGPAGTAGTDGADGANGANGSPGATGPQGSQGPPGPRGPQGEAGMAKPNPVIVVSKLLRPDGQNRLTVKVKCPKPAGLCDGRLAVSTQGFVLGRAAFVIRGGTTVPVRIVVPKNFLKAIAKRKSLTVSILSRDNAGAAALTTQTVKYKKR